MAYTSSNYMTIDVTRSLAIRIKQHEPRSIFPSCPIPASSNNILLRRRTSEAPPAYQPKPVTTCLYLKSQLQCDRLRPMQQPSSHALRFYANDLPNRNEDSKNTLTRQHRAVFRTRLLATALGASSGMTADPARRLDRLQEIRHVRY